jgi:glycosyltransferase GT-like protein
MASGPLKETLVSWPKVLGEDETLGAIRAGSSIARFGDGEFKCAAGRGYGGYSGHDQGRGDPALAAELREILRNPASSCLPCIPTLDPRNPKNARWLALEAEYLPFLSPKIIYGSAFIARDDHAPWIRDPDYTRRFIDVWRDRQVVAVYPDIDFDSRTHRIGRFARKFIHVACPRSNAWNEVDRLERECLAAGADVAVLSCGVTATVLANRLAARGLQALDIGSLAKRVLRKELIS